MRKVGVRRSRLNASPLERASARVTGSTESEIFRHVSLLKTSSAVKVLKLRLSVVTLPRVMITLIVMMVSSLLTGFRRRAALEAEIIALGHQLIVLQRTSTAKRVIGPDGALYWADFGSTENHAIRRIDLRQGTVSTVAGTGQRGDGPDGDPLACKLARPHGVFIQGRMVYICDIQNHRLRMLQL